MGFEFYTWRILLSRINRLIIFLIAPGTDMDCHFTAI